MADMKKEQEREELHRRADELDEILKLPKEEQEKHFVPAEKVFAKLGLPERTEEEKAADPEKEDTGLFFFRGEPGGKVAICNAGGGFMYVGAMQDSFPHALELSKNGYNAFALIYRPGAQTACEDLAQAIALGKGEEL